MIWRGKERMMHEFMWQYAEYIIGAGVVAVVFLFEWWSIETTNRISTLEDEVAELKKGVSDVVIINSNFLVCIFYVFSGGVGF